MACRNRELVPGNWSLVILIVTDAQTYFQTTHYILQHISSSSPTSDMVMNPNGLAVTN